MNILSIQDVHVSFAKCTQILGKMILLWVILIILQERVEWVFLYNINCEIIFDSNTNCEY